MISTSSVVSLLSVIVALAAWILSARDSKKKRQRIEDLELAISRSNWAMTVASVELRVLSAHCKGFDRGLYEFARNNLGSRINTNCLLLGEPIDGTRRRVPT